MNNPQQDKYEKNTRLTVGIIALKRIRALVDGYSLQEKKNKRTVIIIASIVLTLALAVTYEIMLSPDSNP